MRPRRALGAAWALAALIALAAGAHGAAPVDEETVHRIAAQLRCVVCQNLSVADSPSETANQMRGIIRERLAQGETPDQVRAYFVDKYGTWILLEPPRQGFNLLVWVAPFAALLAGLGLVAAVAFRWRRAAARGPAAPEPAVVDEADRERLRRALADLDAR
jgi:cytochrome c-type biogenesis protein CcmH